ncbi:MAG: hypothetical protein SFW35_05530 [Chitinophagales bacterium]|nr:hypothetical protein [Chitinophagales bacterium]
MTLAQVNYLNIALILFSTVLAFLLPFELFLFSYAVLGPLHYLTEIGWLHRKNYFTSGKRDYLFLIALCTIAMVLFISDYLFFRNGAALTNDESQVSATLRFFIVCSIVVSFVAALAMVLFRNTQHKLMFTCIASGILLLFHQAHPTLIILALLLPTLIHVSIFMLAFMLFGSIKSKSISGYLSIAIFVLCGASFFIVDFQTSPVHPFFWQRFLTGDFSIVNQLLLNDFSYGNGSESQLLSNSGYKIQRFIAFAYTYHYLNWFSKTKVIDWHNMSEKHSWLIIVAWISAVGFYLIDFRTGLIVLFFLSMLHVFLEFPLNFHSIIGIGKAIFTK